MSTIRLTVAQALIKFLDQQYVVVDGQENKFFQGVFAIFGHGNVTGIGEALENETHELQFIQGHNEQGMAHAATAFAKQYNRQRAFACTSSIGPGATNMITAAATATINRLPLLLLPGDVFADRGPDPVLQQLESPVDHSVTVNDCFKPVSKYWDRINRPDQLYSACLNAMRVLTDPAEVGAVTLALPQDVQTESFDFPINFFNKRRHIYHRRPLAETALHAAIKQIQQSKRPLIIVGGGVHYSLACHTLIQFVEQFGIPVAETQAGKSVMPANHPFAVGGVGVTGTAVANRLAKQADLILAIGTRLSDFTTASKSQFSIDVNILQLNVNTLDAYKLNATPLLADAKMGLQQIQNELEANNYQSNESYKEVLKCLQEDWRKELKQLSQQVDENGLQQTAVLMEINQCLSADDIIVCAAGSLPGDCHRLWQATAPKSYHMEYGYSCMGYEVAAGMGCKLAEPNKNVYVLVGDGSFLMMHSELVTAIQEGIKINIIVFNNQGYQCIRQLQCGHGSNGYGNHFKQSVDFVALAQALGAKAWKIDRIEDIAYCLAQTKANTTCNLIELPVLPTSMSPGFDTWWRVDVAEVSSSQKVLEAGKKMKNQCASVPDFL